MLGHSVERLCDAAAAFDAAFGRKRGDVVRSGRLLHSDAYPNTVPDSIPARVYTHEAAREAVTMAGELTNFVTTAGKRAMNPPCALAWLQGNALGACADVLVKGPGPF